MATSLSFQPQTLHFTPMSDRTRTSYPFQPRNYGSFLRKSHFRGKIRIVDPFVVRSSLSDLESAESLIKEVFSRVEGVFYTLADAAVNSDTANVSKQSSDWLAGITNYLEAVLKVLKDGLSALHVPYSYGFAIILLTVLVKAATFPLTKKQVESAMAMRSLWPQIKDIQQRYAGDQDRIQLETARLYKLAGVNPLAGCLPTLATIPVWIGLYRALSNVADEGLLTEGFLWIPSLSGPTTIAARQSGSRISWLFPFIDGHSPLGWSDTFPYLVLPVMLVISQYISIQIMQSSQGNDPSQNNSQALTKFLPLMIGYFALSVPSGLSLYWFTNNILSTTQQIWLQKLGGAKDPVRQYIDEAIREEQQKIPKSAIEVESNKAESRQGEKPASGGPRPSERFKQIKEEEARRRKEKEETVESLTMSHDSIDAGVTTGNGCHCTQVSKEDEIAPPKMTNGSLASSSNNLKNNESDSFENLREGFDAKSKDGNRSAEEKSSRRFGNLLKMVDTGNMVYVLVMKLKGDRSHRYEHEDTIEVYGTNRDIGSAENGTLDRIKEQESERHEA